MTAKFKIIGLSALAVVIILSAIGVKKGINYFFPAAVSLSSTETPLEWAGSDYKGGRTDWYTATAHCANKSVEGGTYSGIPYRLPTIEELKQVIDGNASQGPSNLESWFYWSATETSASSSTAYDLDMTPDINSGKSILNKNLPDNYVRCVRNVTIPFPEAPVSVSAVAGNGAATVSFIDPLLINKYTKTLYIVTSNPGGVTITGTESPLEVTGLTNGTSYTFTVKVSNLAGISEMSSSSDPVTPTQPIGSAGGTRLSDSNFGNPTITLDEVEYDLYNDAASASKFCVMSSDAEVSFASGVVTQVDSLIYNGQESNNIKWTDTGWVIAPSLDKVTVVKCYSQAVLEGMIARDAQRVADLTEIKNALEAYKDDHDGKYPNAYNISTNKATTLLSSNYFEQWKGLEDSLQGYIEVLPIDPINKGIPFLPPPQVATGYNYIYASGCSDECYNLYAKLEDPNNPDRCELKEYLRTSAPSNNVKPPSIWCNPANNTLKEEYKMLYSPQ